MEQYLIVAVYPARGDRNVRIWSQEFKTKEMAKDCYEWLYSTYGGHDGELDVQLFGVDE